MSGKPDNFMVPVRLVVLIGEGKVVTVEDVKVLPFRVAPEIIIWGSRFFVPHNLEVTPCEYKEAFAYQIAQ